MELVRSRSLTVVLSHGKSLAWWQQAGLLSRELLLYLHLLRSGALSRILIFSYDAADRDFIADRALHDPVYAGLEVLAPTRGQASGVRAWWWSLVGPVRHRVAIRETAAIKTNQVHSTVAALVASAVSGRPLVMRLGYLLSDSERDAGRRLRGSIVRWLEHAAFARAAHILASSRDIADRLGTRPAWAAKLTLHPTYVDAAAFRPKTDYAFDEPLIWVGRLSRAKNLVNLILACAQVGCDLDLVGAGELEEELRGVAAGVSITVRFVGKVANEDLPALLRSHSIFILPSAYEGLPKALIEAMACGLVCLASDIAGVNDLIRDGENGLLIRGLEPDSIAAAIRRALQERNEALGRRAARTIEEGFGLAAHASREAALYVALDRSSDARTGS